MSRITIKNFVEAKRLSEETMAYTADVYFDGKKVGSAVNRGNGGSTWVHPARSGACAPAETYAKENSLSTSWFGAAPGAAVGEFMTEGLDDYVDVLAFRVAQEKELKRLLSKKILMFVGGELRQTKGKPSADQVRVKYPDAVILNELAFVEALAIYCQATADD